MANLLVEIGTEEIPASFVAGALQALPSLVTEMLGAQRLGGGEVRVWGTPRRIAFAVLGLEGRQPDREEEVTGPPASAAIGPDGKPTKAAEGFARKMGVGPDQLRIVQTAKGPYVAATRREPGRGARAVLAEELPALFGRIPFAKSMKWGVASGPFARPVHWVLCRLGGEVLPFPFAGVTAGGTTRGHRFLAPAAIEIHDVDGYEEGLRAARVVADPALRRQAVVGSLAAAAKAAGASAIPDEALVDQVTFLVEEPHAVVGTFDEVHLALPRPVILSTLRGHQRCFALQDDAGTLRPAFLAVAQTCENPDRVRRGNERVIRARLADAAFFHEVDRRQKLEDRLPALDGMVFQARLGSMGDRARRAREVAGWLADRLDPAAKSPVDRAATLAKADLATQMVGEFPDLQGQVGADYARGQGETEDVARAIDEQYLPRGGSDALPATAAGAILSLADRLVVLAGGFAAGLAPTGAADPFGLRRACIGAIRILWERQWTLSLAEALAMARWQPSKGKVRLQGEVDAAAVEFFGGRVRHLLEEEAPTEMIDACIAASGDDVLDLRRRILALCAFKNDAGWSKLCVSYRRAWNITKDVAPGAFDAGRLTEDAEKALAAVFAGAQTRVAEHAAARRYAEGFSAYGELADPLHRFFSEVFVMVDDEAVRSNRLRFLRGIVEVMRPVAHLHLLGGEAA